MSSVSPCLDSLCGAHAAIYGDVRPEAATADFLSAHRCSCEAFGHRAVTLRLRRDDSEWAREKHETQGNHMSTLIPNPGQQPPSLDRIGVLFPTADEPPSAPLRAGYGRCGVSGCNCPAYGGQGDLCSNCGHNYSSHW